MLSPHQLSFNRPATRSGATVSFRSENSWPILALPLVCGSLASSSGLECLTGLLVWFLHDLIFRQTTSLYFCHFRIFPFFGSRYILSVRSILSSILSSIHTLLPSCVLNRGSVLAPCLSRLFLGRLGSGDRRSVWSQWTLH